MKWTTIVLGVALLLAPFLFGYSNISGALWISLINGAIIAIAGFAQSYKITAIAGLVTFVSPWIFGFSGNAGALWSCLILGGAVAIITGYKSFIADKKTNNLSNA